MQYPVVVILSGPEKTRAKAELALEKARLTIIPPKEWPIQRESYKAEHWPHLTPWPMVRLPEDEEIGSDGKLRQASNRNEYVPAPHVDTSIEHGFVAVLAASEELFHAAYTVAAKHKWDLRSHHEMPEQPKPDPVAVLFDDLTRRLDSQQQTIALLSQKLGLPAPIGGGAFETGAGEFMQTGSYSAAQLRRSVFGWAARATSTIGSAVANTPGAISGGLFSTADMQLSAAGSGLVVNTSTGDCLIPGQEANNQGGYHAFLSSQSSTTLATANGTNPRIDIICATCGDSSYTLPSGGTSGQVTIQGVTGTPTAGATLSNLSGAPTLPLSSLLLGYVLVPAGAGSLTGADIANKATQVALGPMGSDSAWQTPSFVNSWAYASGQLNTGYRKIGNQVFIAMSVTGGTSGTAVFSMPSGYAPSGTGNVNLNGLGQGPTGLCVLTIPAGGGNAFLYFDTLSGSPAFWAFYTSYLIN